MAAWQEELVVSAFDDYCMRNEVLDASGLGAVNHEFGESYNNKIVVVMI